MLAVGSDNIYRLRGKLHINFHSDKKPRGLPKVRDVKTDVATGVMATPLCRVGPMLILTSYMYTSSYGTPVMCEYKGFRIWSDPLLC